MQPSPALRLAWPDAALLARFDRPLRCLSSAALNGGLADAEHWLALQVGADEAPVDDAAHLARAALERGLDPRSVVGLATTADVRAGVRRDHRPATAVATVARDVAVLVTLDVALTDAALVAAAGIAGEAVAHGLAAARLRGSPRRDDDAGSAGVVVCVAAPPAAHGGPPRPDSAAAAAIALTVGSAVRSGARIHRRTLAALGET